MIGKQIILKADVPLFKEPAGSMAVITDFYPDIGIFGWRFGDNPWKGWYKMGNTTEDEFWSWFELVDDEVVRSSLT